MRQTKKGSPPTQTVFEFDNLKRSRRELICRIAIEYGETAAAGVSARSIVQVALALEDHIGKRNCVWPSQETIAEITRLSVRTVKRAVSWMKERGLVVVERQFMGPGRNCLNSYSFMWQEYATLTDREVVDVLVYLQKKYSPPRGLSNTATRAASRGWLSENQE